MSNIFLPGDVLKFSYVSSAILLGVMWLLVAILLGYKGIRYGIEDSGLLTLGVEAITDQMKSAAANRIALMTVTGMMIGYFKGRYVLAKAARRYMQQIVQHEEPITIWQIFTPRYLILIGCMMMLGMLMRFLPIAPSYKAVIDFAVSSALIYGALTLFALAKRFKQELPD